MHQSRRKLTSLVGSGIAIGALALVALVPALSAQAAPDVLTGSAAVSVAVNESNHRVIVGNAGLRSVTVFDGSETAPVKTTVVLSDEPAGIAVDSGLQLAFVTLPAAGKVAVVDLGAAVPVVLRTVSVGTAPNTVAVDPILHRVFVVNNGSANVSSFIGDEAVPMVSTNAVGAAPEGIGIDTSNHTVFVASNSTSTVSRFDGSAATPAPTTISGVSNAGAVSVNSRSHTVYVVDGTNSRLVTFASTSPTPVLLPINVPNTPGGVLADAATGEVYVSTRTDNSLKHFDDTVGGTPVFTTTAVGTDPRALAIDTTLASRYIYVANRGTSFVSRVEGVVPSAPVITSGAPPAATVGVPYTFTFTATGRPVPQFNSTLGLGAEFNLNTGTGVLTGTATAVGPVTFTIEVGNGIAPSATQVVTIQVNAAPTATPTPTPSPTGTGDPSSTATPAPTTTGAPGTGGGTGGSSGSGTGGSGSGGNGGSGGGSGSGSGGGGLAHTGQSVEALAPIGMAALVLSAVGAALVMERRAASRRKRS